MVYNIDCIPSASLNLHPVLSFMCNARPSIVNICISESAPIAEFVFDPKHHILAIKYQREGKATSECKCRMPAEINNVNIDSHAINTRDMFSQLH